MFKNQSSSHFFLDALVQGRRIRARLVDRTGEKTVHPGVPKESFRQHLIHCFCLHFLKINLSQGVRFGLIHSSHFAAVGYPSGQRGQTVNLLAYAFDGSNPSPTTISFLIEKKLFWVFLYSRRLSHDT